MMTVELIPSLQAERAVGLLLSQKAPKRLILQARRTAFILASHSQLGGSLCIKIKLIQMLTGGSRHAITV
jgi:hypothetical protein